jgi:hypothetical protein
MWLCGNLPTWPCQARKLPEPTRLNLGPGAPFQRFSVLDSAPEAGLPAGESPVDKSSLVLNAGLGWAGPGRAGRGWAGRETCGEFQ